MNDGVLLISISTVNLLKVDHSLFCSTVREGAHRPHPAGQAPSRNEGFRIHSMHGEGVFLADP